MKNKKVLVLDFDGVLTVGGEALKQEAWNLMARPWTDGHTRRLHAERDFISGGKGSRYDILHGVFSPFPITYQQSEMLVYGYAACYNTIVQKLLEQSGMPKGTETALAKLKWGRELFVNSATPADAVRESVQNFNIAHFFRGIYGQPLTKEENLVKAQHIAHIDKEYMLFVGDGENDAKAAEEFGCDFVGVANGWNKWEKGIVQFPLVGSIAELPALLE